MVSGHYQKLKTHFKYCNSAIIPTKLKFIALLKKLSLVHRQHEEKSKEKRKDQSSSQFKKDIRLNARVMLYCTKRMQATSVSNAKAEICAQNK